VNITLFQCNQLTLLDLSIFRSKIMASINPLSFCKNYSGFSNFYDHIYTILIILILDIWLLL